MTTAVQDRKKTFATVNLNRDGRWSYELKTLPRPRGKATRVVITE